MPTVECSPEVRQLVLFKSTGAVKREIESEFFLVIYDSFKL